MQAKFFLVQSDAQEDVLLPIKIKIAFRRREASLDCQFSKATIKSRTESDCRENQPGEGVGSGVVGGENIERRLDWPVGSENCCSCCRTFRQSGRQRSGRGGEGVGRARSTAGRPSGFGRERAIRLRSESEGGLTEDLFRSDYSLKGTRHCQENRVWAPEGGDRRRPRNEAAAFGLGTG